MSISQGMFASNLFGGLRKVILIGMPFQKGVRDLLHSLWQETLKTEKFVVLSEALPER